MPDGCSHLIFQMISENIAVCFARVESCQPVGRVDDIRSPIFPRCDILLPQALVPIYQGSTINACMAGRMRGFGSSHIHPPVHLFTPTSVRRTAVVNGILSASHIN